MDPKDVPPGKAEVKGEMTNSGATDSARRSSNDISHLDSGRVRPR